MRHPAGRILQRAQTERQLPGPVLSRCLIENLKRVSDKKIGDALLKLEIDANTARAAVMLAGGRPVLALSIAQNPELEKAYSEWHSFISGLEGQNLIKRAEAAQRIAEGGLAEEFAVYFQSYALYAAKSDGKGGAYRRKMLLKSREAHLMLMANIPGRQALEHLLLTI